MIKYVTGNIFESDAEALVNTVNCQGYMGKGLAYQFKARYPENNKSYIQACKSGCLRPGTLHWHKENGKVIVNFPTKDKWREKSKISYIEDGLDQLLGLIDSLGLQGVAIPPLGSGNGGLDWREVRKVIATKMDKLNDDVTIVVYEPSRDCALQVTQEPKLSMSALVLMDLKGRLAKSTKFRLQKSAYFMDMLAGESLFCFVPYKYGPYDYSIDEVSRAIGEFEEFHHLKSFKEARALLYSKLASASVEKKLNELHPVMEAACAFVNGVQSNHQLEAMATICYIVEESPDSNEQDIVAGFEEWPYPKSDRFSRGDIVQGIEVLCAAGLLYKTLIGYRIATPA